MILNDKYVVQELIAHGPIGVLYKALDRTLNRVIALKVVHDHLSRDPGFVERFVCEARAMARLHHENIVTIFSVEQDRGTQFLVMEYFPGSNLRSLLRQQTRLPPREAVTIALQLAYALAYAHSHGIVHRDVKPANILVYQQYKAKLTDFGIAAAGQVIGTPEYMSPEQARGIKPDGRSDLYSFGMVFYEMLTGHTPYRDMPKTSILGKLLTDQQELRLEFPPDVPSYLQSLIRELTHQDPADRIQSAEALAALLDELRWPWAGVTTTAAGADPTVRIEAAPPYASAPLDEPTVAMREPPKTIPTLTTSGPPRSRSNYFAFVSKVIDGLRSIFSPSVADVRIGAAAPATVRPHQEFVAHFVAYPADQEGQVRQDLAEQSPLAVPVLGKRSFRWAKGTQVEVRVHGDGLHVEPLHQTFSWTGLKQSLDFVVRADGTAPPTTLLKFDVFILDVRIATLVLNIHVTARPQTEEQAEASAFAPRTAFASYAAKDRGLVTHMVGAIERAAGIDVFQDCLDLKAGEPWKPSLRQEILHRDLFLLFWSHAAKNSDWVSWEWRTALEEKGRESMQIHPVEPDIQPPPELSDLHFGSLHALVAKHYLEKDL